MHPQYVATRSSYNVDFVAAESQALPTHSVSYLFHRFPSSFPQGYTQVTYPQKAGDIRRSAGRTRVKNRDRRLTCLRASKAFSLCLCWPSWPHVAQTMPVTLKNLWSSTQFQSVLSQPTQVSSNTSAGQAFSPVPLRDIPATLQAGGCA